MKYYKLEKIVKGDYPIVRVTYKDWRGRNVSKDICRSRAVKNFWVFMESGSLFFDDDPINTFYNNNFDIYLING